MSIKFKIGNEWLNKRTAIHYCMNEFSFDVRPNNGDPAYLLVNNLNLTENEAHILTGVWGLCSYKQWIPTDAFLSTVEKRELPIANNFWGPMVSTRINEDDWGVFINESKQWVCIGEPGLQGHSIEFVPGAVMVLSEQGELLSMWLKVKK